MAIGENVRAERKRLGLTQEALARRADMSKSGVQMIEGGQRTDLPYSTLKKLSGALGLTIGELVEEPNTPGKGQAPPRPETGAAAGLDVRALTEQDLADLYGELSAELERTRERAAELERVREEVNTALIRALNGQSWSLTEMTERAVMRERRRKAASRTAEDAGSEAG